jgi:hypothetical protein
MLLEPKVLPGHSQCVEVRADSRRHSRTVGDLYYPGHAFRIQETLSTIQAHVSYTIRRGLWAAIDSTWYGSGAVRVNNGPAAERRAFEHLSIVTVSGARIRP